MPAPTLRPTTAFTTVDFDGPGKRVGFVRIPHSPDDDAWGVTQLPLAVIANGTGPTVVLEGGNHGDEYEGPITIGELIHDLDPAAIQGRLILMPSNNAPAATEGRRTSPVDGLNLNRSFPGDPHGSITEQIAAYLTDHIFPRADAFLDLHSGGSSLRIIPSAIIEPTRDADLHRRNQAAVAAFGAPMIVLLDNMGDARTATATACRAGLVTVGTEMAGGGGVSIEALDICRRGVRNVLAHLGVIESPKGEAPKVAAPHFTLPGSAAYVFAEGDGVFEPFHSNGDTVQQGQPAGRIHFLWDAGRLPQTLYYNADGVLYGQRPIGRVRPGNCCLVVAQPAD